MAGSVLPHKNRDIHGGAFIGRDPFLYQAVCQPPSLSLSLSLSPSLPARSTTILRPELGLVLILVNYDGKLARITV